MPETDVDVYPKPDVFDDAMGKKMLLKMVPPRLQAEYTKQSLNPALPNQSLINVARWFDELLKMDQVSSDDSDKSGGSRRHRRKGDRNSGNNSGSAGRGNNSHGNGNSRNGKGKGGNGNGKGKGQGQDNGGSNGKKKGEECPWHGSHTWEKCYGNPDGSQYRENFKLPAKKLKKSNDNEDTFVMDEVSRSDSAAVKQFWDERIGATSDSEEDD